MITLYGFGRVSGKVVGDTHDLRVLWALEETGLRYRVRGLDGLAGDLGTEEFRRISPFGQIPVIDDDGFVLAESGAILLYLADKANGLMPADPEGIAQVTRWCFAALNTIEPTLSQIAAIDLLGEGDPTGSERRPHLVSLAQRRLAALEEWLTGRPYLTGDDFTVADILMTSVLRAVRKTELFADCPGVSAYRGRCEARPAWQQTLDDYERRLGAEPGSAR